jgi:ribosome-associated protein
MNSPVIPINSNLSIPLAEVQYRFVRSGGPGGQHVNVTATQVELLFDVAHSPSLNVWQRARLLSKLKNVIDQDGVLHLANQTERSQFRNRELVTARFQSLLAAALRVPKKRRPTKPTAASREKRIESKKQRGQIKQLRKHIPRD